ncbi:uncharacterized protein TNCV_2993691 [Trichonephila clavipes]|nr:uncharacterized protein TNCV_2993691 [Trichonephila clavipes]
MISIFSESHVELYGNEMVDKLTKEGRNSPTPSTYTLTYLELYSLKKSQNLVEWRVLPIHHWYASNRPNLGLDLKCGRCFHTPLSRLASGYIKCLLFSANKKCSPSVQDFKIIRLLPNT